MRFNNTIWVVLRRDDNINDNEWEVDCAFETHLDAIRYIEKEMGEDIPEGVEWEDFYDIQETELK
jgi:hypothetical protein